MYICSMMRRLVLLTKTGGGLQIDGDVPTLLQLQMEIVEVGLHFVKASFELECVWVCANISHTIMHSRWESYCSCLIDWSSLLVNNTITTYPDPLINTLVLPTLQAVVSPFQRRPISGGPPCMTSLCHCKRSLGPVSSCGTSPTAERLPQKLVILFLKCLIVNTVKEECEEVLTFLYNVSSIYFRKLSHKYWMLANH